MGVAVCTHHKCASAFVARYLARFCGLNRLSIFASHMGDATPSIGTDVSLLSNATYDALSPCLSGRPPALHMIRNPLSVVASAYFSHLRTHSTDGWARLVVQRRVLESADRRTGFRRTIAFLEERDFYPRTPGPLRAMAEWNYDDVRASTLRMEDVVVDVDALGHRLAGALGLTNAILPPAVDFAFERFSGGRRAGVRDEGSHYRNGAPDAWREDLPGDVVAYVREHYRALLDRFYPEALAST